MKKKSKNKKRGRGRRYKTVSNEESNEEKGPLNEPVMSHMMCETSLFQP